MVLAISKSSKASIEICVLPGASSTPMPNALQMLCCWLDSKTSPSRLTCRPRDLLCPWMTGLGLRSDIVQQHTSSHACSLVRDSNSRLISLLRRTRPNFPNTRLTAPCLFLVQVRVCLGPAGAASTERQGKLHC